jgi:hypothetical protein
MKYGIEVSDGHRIVYQFATNDARAAWIALAERRSAISGASREVKRALYHDEVIDIGEIEKEISNA